MTPSVKHDINQPMRASFVSSYFCSPSTLALSRNKISPLLKKTVS